MGSEKRNAHTMAWCVAAVGGCFLLGGVLGCLLGTYTGEIAAGEVEAYLRDFMELARAREVSWSVPSVIWSSIRWLLVCVIFGLTAVGVGILPLLFGLRGLLMTFGISCFVRVFGGVGLLPAALLYGIPALLWIPGFLVLGGICLRRSYSTLRKSGGGKLGGLNQEMRAVLCVSGVLLALSFAFECGMLPRLLAAAAHILES